MKGLFLKSTFRNMVKNKSYSLINITGLTFGMVCVILIYLWIQDEYSYDKFHKNLDCLYRIEEDQFYSGQKYHVAATPYPMAETFQEVFPEIVAASPYTGFGNRKFTYNDKNIYDRRIRSVAPRFLEMFSFPLISGDKKTALSEKNSIVISQERAKAIFGDEDPMGKTITIDDRINVTVTGILKDIKQNSSLDFEFLTTIELHKEVNGWNEHWGSNNLQTYVQLAPNTSAFSMTQEINKLYQEKTEGNLTQLLLAPLKRMHLYSYFGYKEGMLNAHYVYIFSVIAIFILVIAGINFINLSTARSLKRAKDIGISKTNGAKRIHIIRQFLSDSLIFSIIALCLSLIIVVLLIDGFNSFTQKEINLSELTTPQTISVLVGIVFFTGLLAGIYPAFVLSSFKPVDVIKGRRIEKKGKLSLNKGLVVFQFIISIMLIIGTTITYKQTRFLKNIDMGFDQKNVMFINMTGEVREQFNTLKSEIEGYTGILSVTGANNLPLNIMGNTQGVHWEGKSDNGILINYKGINYNYLSTLGIELMEGRDCSTDFPTDRSSIIINEEMKKLIGHSSVIGTTIDGWRGRRQVIGVTKNFHFGSPRNAIEPLIMVVVPNESRFMFIKFDPNRITEIRSFIQDKWKSIIPDAPLNMVYVDQQYDDVFRNEEQTASLVKYFAIIAIIIACMGLFGLSTFMLQNKIKEIGVRKVNGAKISEVMALLNRDFVKWIIIAFIIATPVAWYVMNKWLEKFAYKTNLNWWTFAFAGILALSIALLTVNWQSWRAARRNPVEALRYE